MLCRGLEKNGMVGDGMARVNQTRPHCVNQMGKIHSKPLEERHGSGTAWTRHVMCESALRGCNPKVIYGLCKHTRPVILRPITELQGHGKGFPQSAWEFSLHQYLLRRLSTFVLNPNPASSRKNKNAPILYLSNAALLSGHY